MTDMPLYLHFIYSFIATIGFSIFFNAPKVTLIASGIVGGVGWSLFYYLVKITGNDILANFISAIIVSYLSEILARKLRQPAIIFVIPGVIPLVPGLGMYNTMLYLVQNDYARAISKGTNVLFVGGAISLGILVITSLIKTLHIISKKAAK
ncbi:threonine/serine exporter family protein [Terrisporobacter sp.]